VFGQASYLLQSRRQLVLEQFSAEPPFGISNNINNPFFNTPFEDQSGKIFSEAGRRHSESAARPARRLVSVPADLALWTVPKNLRPQYAEQYNMTIQRELVKDLVFQISYVGRQGHRLLASQDLNFGNSTNCLISFAIANANANNVVARTESNPPADHSPEMARTSSQPGRCCQILSTALW